jgi:cytochrome c553
MKKALKILGWVVAVIVVLVIAVGIWMYFRANAYYDQRWSPHAVSFAVPFPLSADELTALRQERLAAGAPKTDPLAGVDLQALARDRAMERGRHLIETRLGCNTCHGEDFGGRVVIDSPMVGYWAAPNITMGDGSVVKAFGVKEWDYAVRHGIRHDLRSSSMPSNEFLNLSDHELSDVILYIHSRPPVNRRMDPVRIGPLFAFMVVTDRDSSLVAFAVDHQRAHAVEPPLTAPTVELGKHIAQVCTSCHGPTFSGGSMHGDPNMPVVANLTPHETGLKEWTEQDFFTALRKGKRKDGSEISMTMPWLAYGQMSDTELKALWAYLQTLQPREKGNH